MNYKFIFYTIGTIMKVQAFLMVLPLAVSIIYKENTYLAFLIPMALLLIFGFLITHKKKIDRTIHAKEGLAIVGLSWLVMSLFGCLPFLITQEIPNFVNAFFETVSGFSTTGASILTEIEVLSQGILFWRSFTHWVGGMGVLVFVLAILPHTNARSMFIMKAESPGPKIGKIVSKVKFTARILYAIYITLTLLQIIFLAFQMPIYDSIVHSLATAGTGGFSIKNLSIAYYNSEYIETVISVFMILFGINFTIFYLLLIGNLKKIFKSEELRWYLGIIIVSILIITLNTMSMYSSLNETLRYSIFQVASIITTTGFSTFDYNTWPSLSKFIILMLMFIGACAGSTGGGIKVSRVVIYFKIMLKEIKYNIHPRQVSVISFEQKPINDSIVKGVLSYMVAYFFILIFGTLIVSIEGKDIITNFTAVLSCLNNIGPGLEIVGPSGNFSSFSDLTKIVLSFIMLVGRLEIFPILILFSPKMWINR